MVCIVYLSLYTECLNLRISVHIIDGTVFAHIIPPIPPMPPMPPPGAPPGGPSSLMSTIIASVVTMREAIPQESVRATLTTFVGSIIPALCISQYSPVAASNPCAGTSASVSFSTTIAPSNPELVQIYLHGILQAFFTILTPIS